jgi:hypothetical protein
MLKHLRKDRHEAEENFIPEAPAAGGEARGLLYHRKFM